MDIINDLPRKDFPSHVIYEEDSSIQDNNARSSFRVSENDTNSRKSKPIWNFCTNEKISYKPYEVAQICKFSMVGFRIVFVKYQFF